MFMGGGIGSAFRFFTGKIFSFIVPGFPLSTLISNVSCSLLRGFIFGFYSTQNISKNASLFFVTGICGGYSTFSTLTLEN